jgi:hypothetical protein
VQPESRLRIRSDRFGTAQTVSWLMPTLAPLTGCFAVLRRVTCFRRPSSDQPIWRRPAVCRAANCWWTLSAEKPSPIVPAALPAIKVANSVSRLYDIDTSLTPFSSAAEYPLVPWPPDIVATRTDLLVHPRRWTLLLIRLHTVKLI